MEPEMKELKEIMNQIRQNELSKLRVMFPISDQYDVIDPIQIGGYYIDNIGNYTAKASTPITISIDTLINNSDSNLSLTSSSKTVSYTQSKSTQVSTGLDIGQKISLTTSILFVEISDEISFNFQLHKSTAITETQTISTTISPQIIPLRPKQKASVTAILEKMEFNGNVDLCIGLSRYEKINIHKYSQNKPFTHTIDMLNHTYTGMPEPLIPDLPSPIRFKELRIGKHEPIEFWTKGNYNVEHATRTIIQIDISSIENDYITDHYSYELL